MSPEELIKKYEEMLRYESFHCSKIAATHQTSKETIIAYKLNLKEARERRKEELKNVEK